jgi:hypothetical protein
MVHQGADTDRNKPRGGTARHFWTGPGTEGRMTPSLPSSLIFLSAVWLGFAPFTLHYRFPTLSGAGDVNDIVLALVVGTLALIRTVLPKDFPWLSLINAVLGGWLITAPFVLDYAAAARASRASANDVLVGVVLLVLGITSALLTYGQRAAARSATAEPRGRSTP